MSERLVIPPKPWEPGIRPTCDQFLDWFLTCPRGEQLRLMVDLLDQGDEGWRCFIEDHRGELALLRPASPAAHRGEPAQTPLAMWMTAEAADITDDCPIGDELAAKYGLDGAAT